MRFFPGILQPLQVVPTPQAIIDDVLSHYRLGWFPMAEDGRVDWYRPTRRALIPLDERFRVSRSLQRRIKSGRFVITSDRAFSRVIAACGEERPERPETWLHPAIVRAFELLHGAGHAHSVEAWLEDGTETSVLVGGLYGVALGAAFCGESMFSRPELGGTDASKVCLAYLVNRLRADGYVLLDSQIWNPHLANFGAFEMEDEAYMKLLSAASAQVVVPWTPGLWQPWGREK